MNTNIVAPVLTVPPLVNVAPVLNMSPVLNPETSSTLNKNPKCCPLCKIRGHHRFVCLTFILKYNCTPLARNDVNARSHLAKSLNLMYGSLIYRRESTDRRVIIKDQMPRERLALVIHKRFYITNAVKLLNNPEIR